MASVKDLKLRIRAIKNTQQITKAMKMVAAARIKKAETKVKASRPYTQKMGEMVQRLMNYVEEPHPFFVAKPVERIGILVITGDKGLCGSYNSNIIRLAQNLMNQKSSCEIELLTIGNKGRQFFSRRQKWKVDHFAPSFYPEFHEAKTVAECLIDRFLSDYWQEIWVVYAHFISAITQKTTEKLLLPLATESKKKEGEFLFEPDAETVLKELLPEYIAVLLYNVMLEARAAELGARLVAMGNATDNAKKLIDSYTLQFYRARQESITTEILEVASGAAALTG